MKIRITRTRMSVAAAAVVGALALGACGTTNGGSTTTDSCPAGQVEEWDDDGLECEPDANNNGVDDEDESFSGEEEDEGLFEDSHKKKKHNKPKTNKPKKNSGSSAKKDSGWKNSPSSGNKNSNSGFKSGRR